MMLAEQMAAWLKRWRKIPVTDRLLCPDFELRGQTYEVWTDSMHPSNRSLVDPRNNEVVDTDHAFTPPLTNDELQSIYHYGKDW